MDLQREYLQGIVSFLSRERSGENERLLEAVQGKPFKVRSNMVLQEYEPILADLRSRPIAKFGTVEGLDELDVFCRALRTGWKLWPDCWVGMLMMLDYIAEKFLPEDIDRLDSETLDTVKQVANTKIWPNNAICGAQLSTAAKNILARHSHTISLEEVTESAFARNVRLMHGEGSLEATMASMSIPPSQPPRRASSHSDQRRCCAAPTCTKVERSAEKFQKCGRCKKAAYCSKACQAAHWKAHKKDCTQCFH